MKNDKSFKNIGDNPEKVKELLAFARRMNGNVTLSDYLNRLMAIKKLTPPQVYHRAEMDRQTYNRLIQINSKIRAAKRTLLQIGIGILATESEAIKLLATCGYTFTSDAEDRAYLFCIRNGLYSMETVYEAIDILEENDPGSPERA